MRVGNGLKAIVFGLREGTSRQGTGAQGRDRMGLEQRGSGEWPLMSWDSSPSSKGSF